MTELTDLSDTDASNTTVTGNSTEGNVANMGGMDNLMQAVLGMLSRFRNDNVFRLRDNSDNTKLLAYELSGLTTATTRTQTVPDESGRQALQAHVAGHLYGLTLSNNVADSTNDIDIAAGNAIDSTNAHVMTLAAALTKRLDAAWAVGTNQGGLDTGAVGNAVYHVFVIKRNDTGVVDVLFSISATAPTMPANYTHFRRIGSIRRPAGAIQAFAQKGDVFLLGVQVLDINTSAQGSTAILYPLSVPSGIKVDALVSLLSTQAAVRYLLATSPDQADTLPSATQFSQVNSAGANAQLSYQLRTDTTGQIRIRADGAATTLLGFTSGWIDTRGRV